MLILQMEMLKSLIISILKITIVMDILLDGIENVHTQLKVLGLRSVPVKFVVSVPNILEVTTVWI